VARDGVGVYVHVPFCQRVCPYCDFAVVGVRALPPELEGAYLDALLAELEQRRAAFEGRSLASLYLGGGTPSLLRPDSVRRIVDAVFTAFPAGGPVETTLEVNPGTVERERLPGFRGAGVNRVSVGVQSFQDTTLKRLGRAHRAEEARRTLAAARAAGFRAVCLDLVFAAPGQGLADFQADLAETLAFGPEHVSAYELTVEEGTPFALAAARGQLRRASEETVVAMIEMAEERLGAAGYERYELSNYARPGFAAVHNRRYWERRPVLGLGVGGPLRLPGAGQRGSLGGGRAAGAAGCPDRAGGGRLPGPAHRRGSRRGALRPGVRGATAWVLEGRDSRARRPGPAGGAGRWGPSPHPPGSSAGRPDFPVFRLIPRVY
jgi:oxygen-independent coproporphyrinogen-3 oxidase